MNEVIGPFFMSICLNLCVTIGINTLRKYKKYKKLESNDNNNVLDCLKIKIEVFNTALQSIKQLLSVKKIIKTYY
jgi:hypothetical protein